MIWRLAHPVRCIVTAVVVWVLLAMLAGTVGFGVGLPELLLMTVVAIVSGVAAGSHTRADHTSDGA